MVHQPSARKELCILGTVKVTGCFGLAERGPACTALPLLMPEGVDSLLRCHCKVSASCISPSHHKPSNSQVCLGFAGLLGVQGSGLGLGPVLGCADT